MIDAAGEVFLRACAESGVDFGRTLMLGRQQLSDFSFAEPFLRGLGAVSVDSLDASNFEGATIIADLNQPLPADLRGCYSAVFDGGTLEHVFDVATALRSCLDLVELGGHYIAISPANNWPGHGFYQFSPEVFFGLLSTEAGFQIRGAFVAELRRRQRWYTIPDPRALGARLYWRNRFRTHLVAIARRERIVDLTAFSPQQSDYVARWNQRPAASSPDGMKALVKRLAPAPLVELYRSARRRRDEQLRPPRFIRVQLSGLAHHIR